MSSSNFLNLPVVVRAMEATGTGAQFQAVATCFFECGVASEVAWGLGNLVIQYAEDTTPFLIRRRIVQVPRFITALKSYVATYWDTQVDHIGVVWLPATYNQLFNIFEECLSWLQHDYLFGSQIVDYEPQFENIYASNYRKLMQICLHGTSRCFSISNTCVTIAEGNIKFRVVLTNFWTWFRIINDNLERMES